MLLESKKRTRVPDEESDNKESVEGFGGVMMDGRNNYKEKAGKVDLKRMRLDLDHENLRISTRSDASSSSSTELLNPYMNINSVLYLANLTRTSHIVNELQDDLGCMEIDERVACANHHGRRQETSSSAIENVGSMDQGLSHDLHYRFQNGEYINEGSSEVTGYQSINAILREAFLRRHQHVDAQD
ncbi:6765_t:CDS:2 [Funneliformis mosseae]|uniref:6765_t:CDS:1 n=1 Tax=Funneliformis mosseae TaxID=27381 RepID=A0A9N9F4S5_FUNMO|nr:6765_t:CDS:2 [Funneliformis mosseae]